jgi:AcrR family transcriptional regulator
MDDPTNREERREAAMHAARGLLERAGASGLSMRKLAGASKMAINTLYAMFGTRDGVLEAIVQDAVEARLAALQKIETTEGSPTDRLEAFVSASIRHAIDNAQINRAVFRAANQLRSLRSLPNAVGREVFTRRLHEAAAAGQLRAEVGLATLAEIQIRTATEASLAWALDEIGDDELECTCLHTLAVVLAAAATPEYAEHFQQRLRAATERLDAARRGATG